LTSRKNHIIGGTVFWVIILLVYFFVGDISAHKDAMWVVLSLLMVQIGAILPDYDLLSNKFLPHRNILTHSIFLPALLTLPIYFVRDETNTLLPLYAFFLIGYGSHLLLDMKPKSWQGSARVHLFWRNPKGNKQMGSKRSASWILINGLILLAAGVVFLYFYQLWTVLP
jgi:membrane-bound metal-dependent hydrolase YbcI (DUF457 family)